MKPPIKSVSDLQKQTSSTIDIDQFVSSPNSTTAITRFWDFPEDVVHVQGQTGGTLSVRAHRANPKESPSRNRLLGTGVMLQTTEDMQFLRSSWHHLNSQEDAEFDLWLYQLAASASASSLDRIGAAIIQICVISCRTAHQVQSLAITSALGDDWTIDPSTALLRRLPPRFADGWTPDPARPDTGEWLGPCQDHWEFALWQAAASELLKAIGAYPNAGNVGELWHELSTDQNFEAWFNKKIAEAPGLQRLTGPALSQIAMTRAYEATPNQGLVRLLGSQPRTGLPAACAYGAYKAPVIKETLQAALACSQPPLTEVKSPSDDKQLNAGGSLLDIDLRKIGQEINNLIGAINNLAGQSEAWVEYHNKLTSLLVISLYASTGGRPINSPFETLSWCDFTRKIIYVEDKISGPTRSSRLCVISNICVRLLHEVYLPHLRALASYLEQACPGFATEIQRVAAGDPEAKLPLFFFLKEAPNLDWTEVTESHLTLVSQISWPLPWNLFRHVHATELVRRGLSPEIVDALLSHGDRGAESHGELSLRIPQEDLEAARPLIDELMQEMQFTLPTSFSQFPPTHSPCRRQTGSIKRCCGHFLSTPILYPWISG